MVKLLVLAFAVHMCLVGISACTAAPLITPKEFFSGLDYSIPGLADVKKAVDAGDYDGASRALLDYMRARRSVKDFVNSWEMPASKNASFNTEKADSIVAHSLPSSTLLGVFPDYKFTERIDWGANPYQDHEYAWTLNRHFYWITLADAYWATHDEKYAQEFVSEMTDWVQSRPIVTDGKHNSSPSWRTIEAGIRMGQTWPNVYQKFLNSPTFMPEAHLLFLMSMVDHARHLDTHPTGGNWLTMERNGLLHVGVLLPEFKESAHWREAAIERLTKELHIQVYPDGAQTELTTGYHRVALKNFVMLYDLCKLNEYKVPDEYSSGLEKMYQAEMFLIKPNGYVPAFNDSDAHIDSIPGSATNLNVQAELRSGAERFARKDMLYAASLGKEGERPIGPSHKFDYAGYYVMRQDWTPDSLYLVFDAGPFGSGHQHEDKLNFEAYAYGETLLFDCGRDSYAGGEYRAYALSSFGHNTALIDGKGQARRHLPAGERKWVTKNPLNNSWVSQAGFDFAQGIYDEGYGTNLDKSVSHNRAILYIKHDYWLVLDHFEGKGQHIIDTLFHFTPGQLEANKMTLACSTSNSLRPNLLVCPVQTKGTSIAIISGQESPCMGWIATGYGKRVAAPVADYKYTGDLPADFAYLIYPSRPSEQTTATITCVELTVDGHDAPAGVFAYTVTLRDGRKDKILLAYGIPGEKRFEDISTDARIAIIRKDADGQVISSDTYGSTYLKVGR